MNKLERRSGEASAKGDELPLFPSSACSGDECEALDPWPIHHVRHRNNVFLRLCTSCVLKYHPGSFCCSCYQLLDSAERPPLVHCSKCPSVVHLCCLPDPSIAPLYLCPACDSPSPPLFSYFPFSNNSTDRVIDLRAAKILFAAARLSAASMSRAAVIARADAEKKVKEAALARRRAREMLDRSLVIIEKEKEKINVGLKVEVAEPKKKGFGVQKRVQNRERDKWKRFSEPIGLGKMNGFLNSDEKDEEEKGIVSGSFNEIEKQD